jgi:hypothetical protein
MSGGSKFWLVTLIQGRWYVFRGRVQLGPFTMQEAFAFCATKNERLI